MDDLNEPIVFIHTAKYSFGSTITSALTDYTIDLTHLRACGSVYISVSDARVVRSVLLYAHRDRRDYKGRGAQDVYHFFHKALEI